MLRLTGRAADGWLPSQSYLQAEDIGPSNRTIDDAARAAGRDPREIRRLLNLSGDLLQRPPAEWVDELVALAVEHGFSTFILPGDSPAAIEAFGQVAPEVRAAVARERRAAGTPTGRARGAAALAQRRPGIDYDALPAALAERAVEPGDRDYAKVRSTYIRRGSPGLVIQARDADDVAAALAYARTQDVPLAIRSAGHGIGGRSTNDGGIVLDVGALNTIELLDRASGRVRLGPGARWGDVATALAPHGLAMSSGDYGGVGVGGLATAGGIGFLARKHGLTIDHVVAAELVLADGRQVRTDAEHEPELLWAVRGAGGNFGVVTALELEAYELGDVVFSLMAYDAGDPAPLLERWAAAVEASPRELTSFLTVFEQRGGSHVAQAYTVYAGDDTAAATEALTPLLGVGPLIDQQAQLVPYPALLPSHGGVHTGGPEPVFRGGLLEHVDADAARILAGGIRSGAAPMLQIRAVGGAVNDLDPLATAYAHRTQNFSVNAVGGSALDALWDELRPHISGLYISFDTDPRPERLHDAFPGETLTRLRELKARYDPDNVFNQNRPIPAGNAGPAPAGTWTPAR
jgi:FAD/FMN-containing dehydrogenase